MMTYQVNASMPTAKVLLSGVSSSCSQRGVGGGPVLAAAAYPTFTRTLGIGAGGGRAAFRLSQMRKFPVIQPLSKSRDGKGLPSGFIIGGTTNSAEDENVETENSDPENDISGRHFLFDQKCTRLEKTRTVIPPLPRSFQAHKPGNLYPLGLSKELSHSHAGRPYTLGCPERHELNSSPAFLFPSALVLNGRNTFSVENCKLSRPKVNYPTFNVLTVKDNQKIQSYTDPMLDASRSFIHRISELSSLEGDTVRQEKLKKMKKPRKLPS